MPCRYAVCIQASPCRTPPLSPACVAATAPVGLSDGHRRQRDYTQPANNDHRRHCASGYFGLLFERVGTHSKSLPLLIDVLNCVVVLSLFLYGAICFRLGKHLLPTNSKWSGAIAAMACFFVLAPLKLFQGYQYELYAVIGVLLPTLFDFSRRTNWDRSLGDLSYPLYLVHWPIGAI